MNIFVPKSCSTYVITFLGSFSNSKITKSKTIKFFKTYYEITL